LLRRLLQLSLLLLVLLQLGLLVLLLLLLLLLLELLLLLLLPSSLLAVATAATELRTGIERRGGELRWGPWRARERFERKRLAAATDLRLLRSAALLLGRRQRDGVNDCGPRARQPGAGAAAAAALHSRRWCEDAWGRALYRWFIVPFGYRPTLGRNPRLVMRAPAIAERCPLMRAVLTN
jgi:hypothetical protein